MAVSSYAQTTLTGSLQVIDQLSLDGAVTVPSVTASDPVFVVIHADDGSGSIGEVIGQLYLNEGEYQDVRVPIDSARATSTLYAVLYVDDNEIGVYEFGAVDGADEPLMVDGEMVVEPFETDILSARDQIADNAVTIDFVTVAEPSWVVIHSGDAQNFGDAIGETFVPAGTSTNVAVEIDPEALTNILWPMIHLDTGAKGRFEFGSVDGADLPLVVNDRVATLPFSSAPIIRAGADSIALNANGVLTSDAATLTVGSTLSDGPGFLVVYDDVNGEPGDMIGFTPVTHGLNRNVTVEVNAAMITPNLWFTLHKDDTVEGEFEFGSVDGADAPVMVNDQVLTFAIPVSPFIEFGDQTTMDNTVTVDRVWYNNPGFVVIYADNGHGGAGKVIGQTAIQPGLNTNVVVELTADDIATGNIFPILHEDTGEVGV
jgi:hypothetical protein